jgi:hypothetical protein
MSTGSDGDPSPSGTPEPPADDVTRTPAGDAEQIPADDVAQTAADEAPQPAKPRTGTTTARERAERQRGEKLESIREQVESGSLVIRKMTDEERERYPARDELPKRPRSR